MKNKRKQKKIRETSNAPVYRSVVEHREETEEAAPRRHGRSLGGLLVKLMAVAAVVALLAVGWQYRDRFMPDGFLVWVDEMLGGSKGNGFPVEVNGSAAKNMTAVRDTLAYLTDTSLVILNDNGGQVVNRSHNFAEPAMKVSGNYVLVSEIGGKRVRLERRSGTVLEHTHFDAVVTAAVSENGRFAVVSGESKSYLSQVSVYTDHDKNIYNWYSADQVVVDLALSPDGKKMAVLGLSSEGGDICSSLMVFRLDKEESEPMTFRKKGVLLCAVQFLGNNQVAAVGDTALFTVKDGALKTVEYGDYELSGAAFSNKSVAVALRQFGTTDGGRVLAVDSSGEQRFSVSFEGTYRDLCKNGDGWLLLTNGEVVSIGRDGAVQKTESGADSQRVVAVGNTVYVMGLTEIRQVSLK